jgi:RNA polymerase sigma factor (sigma-70 family)
VLRTAPTVPVPNRSALVGYEQTASSDSRQGNLAAPSDGLDAESELASAASQGDASAYEQLIQRYASVAFRTAVLITGSPPDAEDAAQEAFWKGYKAIRSFRRGSPFRPWLLQIVSNEAKSRIRSEARRRDRQERWLIDRVRLDAEEPLESVLVRERRETLLQAMERLESDDRLIINLRYYLELSTSETAVVMGCPEGTVKSRLSRALARLRAALVNQNG